MKLYSSCTHRGFRIPTPLSATWLAGRFISLGHETDFRSSKFRLWYAFMRNRLRGQARFHVTNVILEENLPKQANELTRLRWKET